MSGSFPLFQRICAEISNLLDTIIRVHKMQMSAPFADIKQHLFLQVDRWIIGWRPGQGKIYSYLSTCAKNGANSFVQRERTLQARVLFSDLPAETFEAGSYEVRFDESLLKILRERIGKIALRWHDQQIVECVRYMVECIISGRVNSRRRQIINTAVQAYGLEEVHAAFLIDWCQGQVRAQVLDYYDFPIGEDDAWKATDRFGWVPDMIQVIGLDKSKQLLAIFAGRSVKWPSMTQIRQVRATHRAYSTYMSGDDLTDIARDEKVSPTRLREKVEEMHENIIGGVLFERTLELALA